MIERSGRTGLLLESLNVEWVVVAGGEYLDGDVATELQVVGNEDAAHSSATELPTDPVASAEEFQLHGVPRNRE